MKILIVHNKYKILGGEDIQMLEETELLRKNGNDVQMFQVSNDTIEDDQNSIKLALDTVWSKKYYKELLNKIKNEKFDIVHVHNFFPLLSPSIFYAARKAGSKVIMTAHNYRLICPNALMYVNNKICTECVGKTIPYPALMKKCYRDDFSATAATVAMLGFHNIIQTWKGKIDGIICISGFLKKQLIYAGFKDKQLHIKHNFVSSLIPPVFSPDDYYIFVGRTSDQKGLPLLLNVFEKNQRPLIIIGDGPLNDLTKSFASRNPNIKFSGKLSLEETYEKISKAKALLLPSQSHEPFGRTIAEAFAHGTPVVGSDLGGISELIEDGVNGFLFDPYKESGLEQAIYRFEQVTDMASMRREAFNSYQNQFTPDINYSRVMEIYNKVLTS